jgi:hypothetical protein
MPNRRSNELSARTFMKRITLQSFLAGALCLHAASTLRAESTRVIVPVTRDAWVSSVGTERIGNNGAAARLKFKGIQEFSLVDGDFSALKGRPIERAVLRLHQATAEKLGRVTVSTISVPWEEGMGANYAKVPGAACFQLPGTSPDITAVILGNGGSIWRFADATAPDSDGWQSIPIDRAVIEARLVGRSYGFAVMDDVGNEWTREGDAFHWRPFPNRFFYSKEQNAEVAPRFEIWVTDGPPRADVLPSAPPLLTTPRKIDLPSVRMPVEGSLQGAMAIGDLFGRPLSVLRAARGETIWLDVRAEVDAKLDLRGPRDCPTRLFSVEAHGDALVPCEALGRPLLPKKVDRRRHAGHWLVEILVPKLAKPGRRTVHVAADCDVPLEIWDFVLPDRLSFVSQMNAYGLPDAQEIAYYRMAHEHRACLNCLRYSWTGRVAEGCAPKTTGNSWDWAAWDRRFGVLLDGSAFADLPRGPVPVDNFYLPLNENWPMDHGRAYRGGYWIENAYPENYWDEFRQASRRFAQHIAERGWRDTSFEFYLNDKVYFKGERGGVWSRCSASWIFDEPVNTQDFWALRRFGREFLSAASGAKNLVFRCDISRPEWQRDLLDGVCGEEVVSSALRTYRDRILARQARYGQRVFLYGSPNKIGDSNVFCSAWCLDAWSLGADGVVPWNTIGTAQSWNEPDQTCLFYPTEKGPLPSLRLKAFCHGQQLVEYLAIYTQLSGHDRRSVAAVLRSMLRLDPPANSDSADEPATTRYGISPQDLESIRFRLGSWISAKKPADRKTWTVPRSFGPVDSRPDSSFFVAGCQPKEK